MRVMALSQVTSKSSRAQDTAPKASQTPQLQSHSLSQPEQPQSLADVSRRSLLSSASLAALVCTTAEALSSDPPAALAAVEAPLSLRDVTPKIVPASPLSAR